MKTSKYIKNTLFLLAILSVTCSYGVEWVKNGDFENGEISPWKLVTPSENVNPAIVPDSGSPCAGSGALGITLANERRIDIRQNVKIGPGSYKLSAYMDTSRCTKPGGYIIIYLGGMLNGKWHNYGHVSTPGTRKTGWQKTVWEKFEKMITIPEGGVIRSVNITLAGNLTGTAMLDGISIRDYSEEKTQAAQALNPSNCRIHLLDNEHRLALVEDAVFSGNTVKFKSASNSACVLVNIE